MTLMTLRRSLGQRSMSSCSDGCKNLVNATASEPLQKFRPIPTQRFPDEVGPLNNQVLKVMSLKVKVTQTAETYPWTCCIFFFLIFFSVHTWMQYLLSTIVTNKCSY